MVKNPKTDKVAFLGEFVAKFADTTAEEVLSRVSGSMLSARYKRHGEEPELIRPSLDDITKTVAIVTDTKAILQSLNDNYETGLFSFDYAKYITLVHQLRSECKILADQISTYNNLSAPSPAIPTQVQGNAKKSVSDYNTQGAVGAN